MQVYTSCSYVCKLLPSDVVVHVTIRRIYIYIYIYTLCVGACERQLSAGGDSVQLFQPW